MQKNSDESFQKQKFKMKEDVSSSKKREMHWPTVLLYIHLNALGVYGLWLLIVEAKWLTVIFATLTILIAGLGITAGAHRLWAHRSYTASRSLRLFLMLAHTLTGVGSIYDWVLAHRIHHKFYGTEYDPYNHKKGFIHSHILSNLTTEHAEQTKLARDIDMRDIEDDGFLLLQKKLYWVILPIFGILLPMNAPAEYWGESIFNSILILGFFRLAVTLHMSWLVNSANLIWGLKPGEKYPAEDNSAFVITKSYWPHYHYMVPWDYKTGEYGGYDSDCTTTFLKLWEILGLASEFKTATSQDVRDALGKVVTKGMKIDESLNEAYESAEERVRIEQLAVKH